MYLLFTICLHHVSSFYASSYISIFMFHAIRSSYLNLSLCSSTLSGHPSSSLKLDNYDEPAEWGTFDKTTYDLCPASPVAPPAPKPPSVRPSGPSGPSKPAAVPPVPPAPVTTVTVATTATRAAAARHDGVQPGFGWGPLELRGSARGDSSTITNRYKWVCLKMGYTPNYSHLVGIMIINNWV